MRQNISCRLVGYNFAWNISGSLAVGFLGSIWCSCLQKLVNGIRRSYSTVWVVCGPMLWISCVENIELFTQMRKALIYFLCFLESILWKNLFLFSMRAIIFLDTDSYFSCLRLPCLWTLLRVCTVQQSKALLAGNWNPVLLLEAENKKKTKQKQRAK